MTEVRSVGLEASAVPDVPPRDQRSPRQLTGTSPAVWPSPAEPREEARPDTGTGIAELLPRITGLTLRLV